jgi:hypothetical protein
MVSTSQLIIRSDASACIQLRGTACFDVPRGIYFHISIDTGVGALFASLDAVRVRSTTVRAIGVIGDIKGRIAGISAPSRPCHSCFPVSRAKSIRHVVSIDSVFLSFFFFFPVLFCFLFYLRSPSPFFFYSNTDMCDEIAA